MNMLISLSHSFMNKQQIYGDKQAFSKSFVSTEISVDNFIHHVVSGKAWAVGTYTDNHRTKNNFVQSKVLALDLDKNGATIAECLENAVILAYAALLHPSASSTPEHPKTRIVFVLETPITGREQHELASLACLHRFRDLQPDTACKDAARFYYGSDRGEAVERPNLVLPDVVVARWITAYNEYLKQEDEQLKVAPGNPDTTSDNATAYAEKAYRNTRDELADCAEGERNISLNKAAYKLFGMARGGWPGISDARIEIDLMIDATALELKKSEILTTINSAKRAASPRELRLSDKHEHLNDYNVETAKVTGAEYQQATMNTLQRTLATAMMDAKNGELSADELQQVAEKVTVAVDSLLAMSGNVESVTGIIASRKAGELYKSVLNNPQWVQGRISNLKTLDYAIGGILPGQCLTFLGEAGTGKTTLAATLAANFAMEAPGLIISCENTEEIFIMKMWAYSSRIPFGDIRRGGQLLKSGDVVTGFKKHTDEQRERIAAAQSKVLRLMDSGTALLKGSSPSPAVIRAFVRKHASYAKWLIIDSLNNVQLPYYSTEYENMSRAALMAEGIAVDYPEIAVVNTCQIGRAAKGRANKAPEKNDARGSGIVEEKAAVLVGLYNHWDHVKRGAVEEQFRADGVTSIDEMRYPKGTVQCEVLKLRDGESGTRVNLVFRGGCGYYNE